MKVTACFNVAFDAEVPDEIVEKAREFCKDGRDIEYTELFEKIQNAPEFKQIFSGNIDGEITAIYTPDKNDPYFEDIIWED